MDQAKPTHYKALEAVKTLIRWAGDDPDREGLVNTPERVLKTYKFFFSGYAEDPHDVLSVAFHEINDYDGSVVLRNIRFESHCEHHMLPFIGYAHIAYLPNKSVVGISKLARVVEIYAKRLQIQERLTMQIAQAIQSNLEARGVLVVLEASHLCITCRGIHKTESAMTTSCGLGEFNENKELRREMLSLFKLRETP